MSGVPATQTAEAVYLTSNKVLARYSRKSHVWLWRLLRDDPEFPRPLKIRGMNYWRISELDQYDQARAA
jgi:predicted DNA-binding transcriptional regulator AlpA